MADTSTPLGVAVVGAGTVGSGVIELLQNRQEALQRLCNRPVRITHVVKRNLAESSHLPDEVKPLLTNDWRIAVNDDNTDIVVELIGGKTDAAECIRAALAAGKAVVTANKALLAELPASDNMVIHTTALEAAIAGCIPIVKVVREALAGDAIHEIYGVINGTCNYILTTMEEKKTPFAETLREAQALGYAEADPALDIDGMDAAHKLALLCRLAFAADIRPQDFSVAGIRDFDWRDIGYARQFNFRIKLLAAAKLSCDNQLKVGVRPMLVPRQHLLASVEGAMNAIVVRAEFSGETMYYGAGAGAHPTAVAVVADIIDAANKRTAAPAAVINPNHNAPTLAASFSAPHYLRLRVTDRPGILASVTHLLAEQDISIEAIHQNESQPGNPVDVVILLHEGDSERVAKAVANIQQLPDIQAPVIVMPIARLGE